MRPQFLVITLVIILAIFAVIFWVRPTRQAVVALPIQKPTYSTNNISVILSNTSQNIQNISNQQYVPAWPTNSNPTSDDVQKFIQKANENYHKPIEFYGQVIDQNSNPLPDVEIKVSITQEQLSAPTAEGSYPINDNIIRLEKETAADGRFEITGEWGSWLNIESVEKPAYEEELGDAPHNFNASIGAYANPNVFKMWSTNIHEQLITGEKSFDIVPDGKPYFIDLSKGEISQTEGGDLKVWIKYPEETVHTQFYDWSCEIDVINGGLQPGDSYSMFSAPTDGYVPSFSLQQKIRGGGRGSIGNKKFYVMLNNGKIFGRIQIDLVAPFNTGIPGLIRLSYAINPSGSRILR